MHGQQNIETWKLDLRHEESTGINNTKAKTCSFSIKITSSRVKINL